jgi:hypothetical protein
MLEAFYDWVAARSPKYKKLEHESFAKDREISELGHKLFMEQCRYTDRMTDIAWLQAEIQKADLPIGTLRKAIASTSPDFSANQEIIRVNYPLDMVLARVLPVPLLIQKIAEAMMDAALVALARRFSMPEGVRESFLPASGKSEGV